MFAIAAGQEAPALLEDAYLPTQTVREVQTDFAKALSYCNPADPDALDQDLVSWNDLAGTIGGWIAECVAPGDRVAILPGRSLVGLPIHLCPVAAGGTSLIEEHAVIYAGNFSLLLRKDERGEEAVEEGTLCVAVGKNRDTSEFRARLAEATRDIGASCAPHAEVLIGKDATLARIKTALNGCEEAYFLCHGAYGGRKVGFAICISDGVSLPPSLLDIDNVPELKRFTLDWMDLSDLNRTPRRIVSIACSTGRTLVIEGGSRLGIEQSVFALGTRSLISPQWDIDQDASIAWIKHMNAAREASGIKSAAELCRTATISTKQQFQHPFFWGAFAVTGSIFY